jgi:excisionase family DNA binding protein
MPDETKPLFVRLPTLESDRLSELSRATGRSKRQLVGEAVRQHLTDSGELLVGRAELREPLPEVMTLAEAAAMLRIDDQALADAASRGETPGRRFGDEWRFSREGLLAWLAGG